MDAGVIHDYPLRNFAVVLPPMGILERPHEQPECDYTVTIKDFRTPNTPEMCTWAVVRHTTIDQTVAGCHDDDRDDSPGATATDNSGNNKALE